MSSTLTRQPLAPHEVRAVRAQLDQFLADAQVLRRRIDQGGPDREPSPRRWLHHLLLTATKG